jgi:hypothetical protein
VDNLPWLESTVKEQVGQSLLTHVEKLSLEAFPDLIAGSHVLQERLSWENRLWQWNFFWSRGGSQPIQNGPIQTHKQVLQRSTERVEIYLLIDSYLPESLKCRTYVVLCVVQMTQRLSIGMTMKPATHYPIQALLHLYPGILIGMHACTAKYLYNILIIGWIATLISAHFLSHCQFLQREDTYTAHAQDDQLAAHSKWPIGEDIGLLTAGTAYLLTIDEKNRPVALDFDAIGMPPWSRVIGIGQATPRRRIIVGIEKDLGLRMGRHWMRP